MTKKEAALSLQGVLDCGLLGCIGVIPDALRIAIGHLRSDVNEGIKINLPDDGMCAIVRKTKGRYEVDTGRVEKWPE